MQRVTLVCDSPGCGCEKRAEDPRPWLALMVIGGHDHQQFDFCPDCAAKLRALMPAGPERPDVPALAEPPSADLGPEPEPEPEPEAPELEREV